jgi:hypothetical protein
MAVGVGQRIGVFTICARLTPVMFSVIVPPRVPSVADGVAHNPASLAAVRCANVMRSKHTPLRIKPHCGKITEDSGKSSPHKQR